MTDYYVLHSGGLDSTTALADTLTRDDARNVYAIGVDYGQRHITELQAAHNARQALNVPGMTLDLTGYGKSVKSALTADLDVPDGDYNADNMADTEVPGRNAVMLAAVAGMAASHSGDHPATIITAVHGGDHHIYPDCRPEFITAIDQAIRLAVPGVSVEAPFVNMTKTDIARIGHAIGAPLHLTWSCYKGGDTHCGTCSTCRERRDAFTTATIPDPTEYRT